MASVFVVGSVNQDIVVTLKRAPAAGETVFGESLSMFPGGKGANQAVASARMGAPTFLIGKVGADSFGEEQVVYLENMGVETRVSQADDVATGTAVILVDAAGENRIAVVPGANANMGSADCGGLNEMSAGDVLLVQNEIPLPATIAALGRAKAQGATTIFNVAPAVAVPPDLVKLVDLFIVNETEFAVLTGAQWDADSGRDDWQAAIKAQSQKLAAGLIVTVGAQGVVGWFGSVAIDVPGKAVTVVDTTGAGDCFCGVFAAQLASGIGAAEAAVTANLAAAECVKQAGASVSFPWPEDLKNLAA